MATISVSPSTFMILTPWVVRPSLETSEALILMMTPSLLMRKTSSSSLTVMAPMSSPVLSNLVLS